MHERQVIVTLPRYLFFSLMLSLLLVARRRAHIGMEKDGPYCACGSNPIACDTCRSYFAWSDGTAATWQNWKSGEPNRRVYVHMKNNGEWGSHHSSRVDTFCQRCK